LSASHADNRLLSHGASLESSLPDLYWHAQERNRIFTVGSESVSELDFLFRLLQLLPPDRSSSITYGEQHPAGDGGGVHYGDTNFTPAFSLVDDEFGMYGRVITK
jgi:hypothetical protein